MTATMTAKIPLNWEWVKLDDLLVFGLQNGFSPKPVEFRTDTKVLALTATTSGCFKEGCYKYIENVVDKDSFLRETALLFKLIWSG